MRCQAIVRELDAYLTGELDAVESAEVERHLDACDGCRAELELLQKENAIYREYASAIDVPGDETLRILANGGRRESGIHWWRWAVTAAVLVVAVLSWRFYAMRQDAQMAGNAASGQIMEIPVPVHQAVRSYEQALLLLQASYKAKKSSLDPGLVQELDHNLGVAEAAVAECKLALKKHPNNPQVIDFLLLDYDKQVGILKQITEAL